MILLMPPSSGIILVPVRSWKYPTDEKSRAVMNAMGKHLEDGAVQTADRDGESPRPTIPMWETLE